MCRVCLSAGLGKVASENLRAARSEETNGAQFGRRQFLGGALALAGVTGLAGMSLQMLAGWSAAAHAATPSKDGLAP